MNTSHISYRNDLPVVTVAMPVLNGGEYLQLAVQSIVAQTFRDWELLILDDGSTDGAINAFLNHSDHRINVIRDSENKGLSARLNQAIDMARGRYLARMDHDDVSHPDRLAQQVAFLEGHTDVDLVATKCVTINEMHRLLGTLPFAMLHQKICSRPWMGFPMPHPSWMGRVSWFRRHYYQEPAPYCCEDNELLLRAYKTSCYHAIEPALLAYRVRTYPSWQKMWRTRKAMAAVQINFFVEQGSIRFAALSCLVALLRVARDLWWVTLSRAGLSTTENDKVAGSVEWIEKIRL